ncbi:hypothetical protein Ancab_012364 [Ancistrocladus abbreviatus]
MKVAGKRRVSRGGKRATGMDLVVSFGFVGTSGLQLLSRVAAKMQQLSLVEHVHSGSSNKLEGHPAEQTNKTAPVNCPSPKHTARKALISGKLSGDYEVHSRIVVTGSGLTWPLTSCKTTA